MYYLETLTEGITVAFTKYLAIQVLNFKPIYKYQQGKCLVFFFNCPSNVNLQTVCPHLLTQHICKCLYIPKCIG